jgi:hypothetical protein
LQRNQPVNKDKAANAKPKRENPEHQLEEGMERGVSESEEKSGSKYRIRSQDLAKSNIIDSFDSRETLTPCHQAQRNFTGGYMGLI